jgi:hypothetical protein
MTGMLMCAVIAQGLFAKTYGGTDFDHGKSLIQASDGGYVVAGNTRSWGGGNYDLLVMRTDASGNFQWARTFGGASSDDSYGVVQAPDGGYAVCGSWNTSVMSSTDILFFKLDASGNLLWAKQMGGANEDQALSVILTSDGGYALAGVTQSYGAGGQDFIIVKTDSLGSVTWARTFGGSGTDGAWSIARASDGGYVVAGWTGSFGAGGSDFMVVKLDSAGTLVWARALGGTGDDYAFSVSQATDGNYLVAGRTNSFNPGFTDYLVAKLDPSGTLLWDRICGRTDAGAALSMTRTNDGGCAITGRTSGLFVAKLDASGNLDWARTGPGSDGWGIVQTSDAGYAMSGYRFVGSANDVLVLRLDSNGNYPGCVSVSSPNVTAPTLTVNSPTGLLTCSPPAWTPTWTTSSPTLTVADACPPLGAEETDDLPGPAVVSSPAPGGALFFCGESSEIAIYSVDGRLAYMGQLQPGANRVPLSRGVYLWRAGAYRGKVAVR